MATLKRSIFGKHGSATAIVMPPTALAAADGPGETASLTYDDLRAAVDRFRADLERTGLLEPGCSVSMSLVNGLEFVVAFLAVGEARCTGRPPPPAPTAHRLTSVTAAPLNPTYTQEEAGASLMPVSSADR